MNEVTNIQPPTGFGLLVAGGVIVLGVVGIACFNAGRNYQYSKDQEAGERILTECARSRAQSKSRRMPA